MNGAWIEIREKEKEANLSKFFRFKADVDELALQPIKIQLKDKGELYVSIP